MQAQKSKVLAGILAILFGSIGVHNFYLGNINLGLVKLVVALACNFLGRLLFFLFVPFSLISSALFIWGVVDGVLILTGRVTTDEAGNPLV